MFALANTSSQLPDIIGEITAVKSSASDPPADKNHLMVTTKLGNDACVTLSLCNDPIPQAQQSPINLQETLDFEPSERDIGELSQPPSTEIRSVTPPPSHALGNPRTAFSDWLSVGHLVNRRYLSNHWVSCDFKATSVFVTSRRVRSRSFIRRAAATRPHAQEEDSRVNLTCHRLRRTFARATAAGHRPFAAGKPPPHHRRASAAAGDFPVSHHRCWPPPATGLRRLAGRLAGNSVTRPSRLSESSR
ncbi:uncharacterized protein LOC125585012 isoform X2 [Brassica napus]|uniref:uncharacterized protein LOC125585012 isoform X2 n=1 Tax=Brassica napus TaxID=3708 RepID=UPI00207927C9|nr:uncharacterized protein LOC125585012 isoform X2 [Brassica napus]